MVRWLSTAFSIDSWSLEQAISLSPSVQLSESVRTSSVKNLLTPVTVLFPEQKSFYTFYSAVPFGRTKLCVACIV